MISVLEQHSGLILSGLGTTVLIVVIGFLLGCFGGVALTFAQASRLRVSRAAANVTIEVVRNTPFLIQASLMFAILGVMRIRIDPEIVAVASVALYTSAYMAEILRGALQSVPAGQREAARSLGISQRVTFRKVIMPQLLPFAVPASANLLATVTKESAFLAALSVSELTFSGQVVIAQTFAVFEVWAIIGILYVTLILSLFALTAKLERSFSWATNTRSGSGAKK